MLKSINKYIVSKKLTRLRATIPRPFADMRGGDVPDCRLLANLQGNNPIMDPGTAVNGRLNDFLVSASPSSLLSSLELSDAQSL